MEERPTSTWFDSWMEYISLQKITMRYQRVVGAVARLSLYKNVKQNGLQQRDLAEDLGSTSNVSLILAGKRNLTLPHVQRLIRRFGVPASVFLKRLADAA